PLGDDDYYTYKTSIIRKDISMVVNVKYYNVYGLMKELKINDIKTIDNIETAHQMVMENYENKHKTVLNISNIRYNTGIEDNLFKVSTIERGRL
ncbi:MAG: outer membrane lipoprotein-sorting protein, partial [Candidatus Cloacimonetes bacterium]|nr:outer membrane lipoprotein-sorting protein [Candidatus Cloacimonadota bacterium]